MTSTSPFPHRIDFTPPGVLAPAFVVQAAILIDRDTAHLHCEYQGRKFFAGHPTVFTFNLVTGGLMSRAGLPSVPDSGAQRGLQTMLKEYIAKLTKEVAHE